MPGWFPIAGLPWIPLGMPQSCEAPTDFPGTSFLSSSIGDEFKFVLFSFFFLFSIFDNTTWLVTYLLFHLSDEFERLQGKEADCNLLLKTDFHQKNLQRGINKSFCNIKKHNTRSTYSDFSKEQ